MTPEQINGGPMGPPTDVFAWASTMVFAALIVVGFISHSGFEIARKSTRILSDRIVIEERDIERIVMTVPGILGCLQIRTRAEFGETRTDLSSE